MREILFRGKRVGDGKWVYGSLILADEYCCILEAPENVHPMDYPYLDPDLGTIDGKATPVIPETVGQYICMKDKHGTQVFEGDILFQTDIHGNSFIRTVKYEMSCGSCCTQVYGFGASGSGHTDFIRLDDPFEVIGNIHDNPEILIIREVFQNDYTRSARLRS